MDSLFIPPNIDRKLKLEKEQIIANFRKEKFKAPVRDGTVSAFMNMFSTDAVGF